VTTSVLTVVRNFSNFAIKSEVKGQKTE